VGTGGGPGDTAGQMPTSFINMEPAMGLPLGIYTNHFGKNGKIGKIGCGKDGRHGNCQYHGVEQGIFP